MPGGVGNPPASDGYYTGPTSINAGTLSVTYNGSGNGGIGTLPVGSSITVSSGATLLASGFNALGYASTHAGDLLTVNQGGSLTIDAGVVASMPYALNVVGGTIASVDGGNPGLGTLYYQSTQGTFTSASDGTPAAISAQNFNLQGAQFNVTDGSGAVDLNVTGSFMGGGLTKNGSGVMQLANSGVLGYGGATTVNGGTLIMPSGSWQLNGIANSPITVNAGATLQLPADPSEYSVAPTLNGGTITSSGVNNSGWPNITLSPNRTLTAGGAAVSTIATWLGFSGNGTLSVGSGSTLNITGPLTGDWITARTGLFKTGDGTLTLSSAASGYDCDTTISAGTLALGGAGQLSGGNYGYNITNNAALVYGSSAYQVLSGAIGGTGTLTQSAGTLVLSGANTYTGQTTVNGGFLDIYNTASVGGTSGITVNGAYGIGGQLRFDTGTGGGTISTPISVIGGAYTWHMSVAVPSNLTFTGPINLSGGALIVSEGGNSTLNFNNALHGTEGLTFAALSGAKNFMVLSAASDFSGNLAIVDWNGSPQVTLSGGDDRLPTTALVSVNGHTVTPGALDLNGNNQTIAGLTDAGGFGGLDAGARHVVNTSGTAATLTLNTTANQSSGVSIGGTDISGTTGNNLALVKSGIATQTLSGANTYTGDTTVVGGTLSLGQVNSNNESSTVSIAASVGAKLDLAFAGIDTVGSLYINGAQQPAGNYTNAHPSGAFTGGGTLHVGPAGYAIWKAANAPTGTPNDDYDGDGVSNGVEFVLGGTKDTNDLSKLPAISTSNTDMAFSFQRTQASIDGTTTVVIQVGTDLNSWPDTYTVLGTAQVNNPGVTIQKDAPSVGTDTVILTVPRGLAPTKFARLVVTPAP
jgi:autotransporter-associated beta strand protein